MLTVVVPAIEYYDEKNNVFIYANEQTLKMEHSLISLSKWESKWNKPFLSSGQKSTEEILDYYRCMTVNENVDPNIYRRMTAANHKEINEYIQAPMTATTFSDKQNGRNKEIITSELIYYWMISLGIPMECQKWHLNRLFALIKVCSIKNTPPKKMSKAEILKQNHALNAARRHSLGTRG